MENTRVKTALAESSEGKVEKIDVEVIVPPRGDARRNEAWIATPSSDARP